MTQPSTSAPALTRFTFKSTDVRTIEKDGLIWFVASDIAKALNYAEAKDMTRFLDDDEKGRHIVPTPSGDQEVTIINESGLYHALLKSRKPEAQPFRRWVTAEVLPAIRKEGGYANPNFRPEQTRQALPHGLSIDQQDAVKALVKARVATVPKEKQAKAAITLWSSIKSKFGVGYKEVPPENFTEVLSLAARVPLEGDYLPAEDKLTVTIEELDALVQMRMNSTGEPRPQFYEHMRLDQEAFVEIDRRLDAVISHFNPTSELFNHLHGIYRLLRNCDPLLGRRFTGKRFVEQPIWLALPPIRA